MIYFSDEYPNKLENIGKEKVPGDFDKKTIHKMMEDVVALCAYRATSIEQFRTARGTRRMYQPYWLKKGQGVHLITPDMDVDKFQLQIEHGEVFIQEKYLEVFDKKSNSIIIR